LNLIAPFLKKGIVNDKDLLDPDVEKGVIVRNIQTRGERRDRPPFTFLDLKETKAKLRAQADLLSPTLGKEFTPIVLKIAESFLRANLTLNKNETEERKAKTKERVNPVYFQVKRGESILRSGERVREEHFSKSRP